MSTIWIRCTFSTMLPYASSSKDALTVYVVPLISLKNAAAGRRWFSETTQCDPLGAAPQRHFVDNPKPLLFLRWMVKVADRLFVNCFNPCPNFFLRSTERGFLETHTKAWFHNRALAGFLKILQRMSQPATISGKRINDLSG